MELSDITKFNHQQSTSATNAEMNNNLLINMHLQSFIDALSFSLLINQLKGKLMQLFYIESFFGRGVFASYGDWSLSKLLWECRKGEAATEVWLFGGRLYLCVDSKPTEAVATR